MPIYQCFDVLQAYDTIQKLYRLLRNDYLQKLMLQFPNMHADYLHRIASNMAAEELKNAGLI